MKRFIILIFLYFISITPASALDVNIHVHEKYTDIQAGDRFYFEIAMKYPENPSRKDIILNYKILQNDEFIAQAKVLKAIETQASFIDFIVIPESAESGMYVINVEVSDYEDLNHEVEASFHVVSSGNDNIEKYLLTLIGLVSLLVVLVIVNIIVSKKRYRDFHDVI